MTHIVLHTINVDMAWPQSMEIQPSQANIKGDMSNFMENSENFLSN